MGHTEDKACSLWELNTKLEQGRSVKIKILQTDHLEGRVQSHASEERRLTQAKGRKHRALEKPKKSQGGSEDRYGPQG